MRKQLDENSIQREQLEKIQVNIVEELRSIRNRLEVDSSNINSLTAEVRQRTRKLEDDHRMTVSHLFYRRLHLPICIFRVIFFVNIKKQSMLEISSSIHFELLAIRSKTIEGKMTHFFFSLKFRMNEHRDLFNELKTRLDFEREDRRMIETQLASK